MREADRKKFLSGRYIRFKRLPVLLATVVLVVAGPSPGQAKEVFKDEAGRTIYTIDDEGIVSMFENSPTDLTISVSRGTREKMQPRVTEVSPELIHAGTSVVLRLRGENLVGATVKMSVSEIEIKPFSGKPQIVEIPIQVSGSVPPGEVSIVVTTPIGTTKTSFKVGEMQIGGGGPARRDEGGRQTISVAAPTTCPPGMIGVGAERGGFCIEVDRTFSGDLRKAEQACAIAGKRLCTASEWMTACEGTTAGSLALKNMIGDWEWTGTQNIKAPPGETADYGASGELNAVLMGLSDCKTNRDYQTWRTETIAGRCCRNP